MTHVLYSFHRIELASLRKTVGPHSPIGVTSLFLQLAQRAKQSEGVVEGGAVWNLLLPLRQPVEQRKHCGSILPEFGGGEIQIICPFALLIGTTRHKVFIDLVQAENFVPESYRLLGDFLGRRVTLCNFLAISYGCDRPEDVA